MTNSDAVWTAYGERLRKYLRSRAGNDSDADDLLQEVFAKIQTRAPSDPQKLEAWLFQVARRSLVDHFRRRGRTALLATDPPAERPSETVTAEVASWLRPMMEALPETDREALRLTDLEGLGQKELAEKLNLSLTGAKSRVQRARRRLKTVLLDCCYVEFDRRGNALSYTPRNCGCA